MLVTLFWIPATLMAAAAQTARNAMQHHLTSSLGTLGATQVRFLYGLPFAALFLALISLAEGRSPPAPNSTFLLYTLWGALAQIAATALMLAAMKLRSFTLAITYIKTEPIQVALFAWLVLGEQLSAPGWLAVCLATAGVIVMSRPAAPSLAGASVWWPATLGLLSGAAFALASVGFRGAILSLEQGSPLLRASTSLTWGLALQTLVMVVWLLIVQRDALFGSLRVWKASLFAGFMGAFASQCWFLAFALTSVANVRTLGLVEVLFAQMASRRLFSQSLQPRERIGLILVVAGVALLVGVVLRR